MKSIKTEEMIHGNIYSMKFKGNTYRWIVKFDEINDRKEVRHIGCIENEISYSFSRIGWMGYTKDVELLYEPSDYEKAWLEECLKQRKWVPLEKIKLSQIENNYEIY